MCNGNFKSVDKENEESQTLTLMPSHTSAIRGNSNLDLNAILNSVQL